MVDATIHRNAWLWSEEHKLRDGPGERPKPMTLDKLVELKAKQADVFDRVESDVNRWGGDVVQQ